MKLCGLARSRELEKKFAYPTITIPYPVYKNIPDFLFFCILAEIQCYQMEFNICSAVGDLFYSNLRPADVRIVGE